MFRVDSWFYVQRPLMIMLRGTLWNAGIEPRMPVCKVSTFPIVLSLWTPKVLPFVGIYPAVLSAHSWQGLGTDPG